jgi:WD40 repeat protein
MGSKRLSLGMAAARAFQSRILLLLVFISSFLLPHVARADERLKIEVVPQIPHSHDVMSVAFSPDGARVLSGSKDGRMKLWHATTGALMRTFEGHSDIVYSVAFSPDGTRVVSGSDDETMKLWDAATGRLLRTFEGAKVVSVAFSPDGTRVVAGTDHEKGMMLWEVTTGDLLHTFPVGAWSVAFSPDGSRVLSGDSEKTVKLWDALSGQLLRTFEGNSKEVFSVAFSPDGQRVVSGGQDGTIRIWDTATGALLRTIKADPHLIHSVAFSPNGARLVSGGEDWTLKLWDVATGALVRTFVGHAWEVYSVAFSPDGERVLSGAWDRELKLWEVTTGKLLHSFAGFPALIRSVAFSPDGARVISASAETQGNTLKLWDAATGRLLRASESQKVAITSVAFSPDGTRIVSGNKVSWDKAGGLKLWDAATGALMRTFEGHPYGVNSVAFSPDGTRVLSASNEIKLWDAATGALLRTFEGHKFEADNLREIRVEVTSVAFSPDGARVLSGGKDGSMKLWDASNGQLVRTFRGQPFAAVESVVFSSDGERVLSGGMDLKLWDAATGALLQTFGDQSGPVHSIAFSPDGTRVLADSSDSTLKLWDVATGALMRTLEGHLSWISSVAFSPDGRQIISGSADSTIRRWDGYTGQLLASTTVSGDGEWLVITPEGFFSGSGKEADQRLAIVRGVDATIIGQVHQSLFNPDLVRESLAGDPDGEVKRAAEVVNLQNVLDSGPAPIVAITAPGAGAHASKDLVTVEARITDKGQGVGRIEWRVNGITAAVMAKPAGAGPVYTVSRQLAIDVGDNTIEVVAYNESNLLASLPMRARVRYTGRADKIKPKLHVLAIGINNYVDKGWVAPGDSVSSLFPKLDLAVGDAKAIASELKRAGAGLYRDVRVRTVLNGEATAANLDAIVTEFAVGISPRDTFILFAAAHGSSHEGRFYLIPQDYQGGRNPEALKARAIGQLTLQDWIANRVKAKKALILLDTCESGALTSGYLRSRVAGSVSDASIGRLHEATGRPVLTAAAQGQSAFEFQDIKHGIFTAALIDGLRRAQTNRDGVIMLSSLVAYVQDLVPKLVKDPKERQALLKRGSAGGEQAARFGSRGEDFAVVRRLH